MKIRENIKALNIYKLKSFRFLIIIESIILLFGVIGLFGKDKVYEYGLDEMRSNFGVYNEELNGYSSDSSVGTDGNMVDFCDVTLPKGVYSVSLHYATDTDLKNMCQITDYSIGYKSILTNGEHLYAGLNQTDFNMWLLEDASQMIVHVYYGGEGNLTVTGLTISETNALNRILLFCVVVGSLFINACYIFVRYNKEYKISVKNKNVLFGLGLILLFSSIPLMADFLISSGDLGYHLMRIEGIKDGILTGQFPLRIAPKWQQGYGYPSAIFYGETLLYIAAAFRLIGFSVLTSYRLFFFVINIATVLISYFCFKKLFQEKYIGLLCSMVYSLSVARIYRTFLCGSFGESFGLMFLPFLAYGFYRVFSEDVNAPKYKKSYIPLMIGYTGLIQSHLLSGELAGFFTILLCILLWKKVFRKQTFIVLAKTVIYSVLLSAWFVVPFADYMLTGDYVINNVWARTIQARGLYPAHLLLAFSTAGSAVFFEEDGMYNSQPVNIGIGLVITLIIWLGLLFFRKTKNMKKEEVVLGKIAALFAVIAMCMSLSVFPWDKIQSTNRIVATLVSSIQFPSRFLSIVTISLTIIVGVVAKWIVEHKKQVGLFLYGGAMAVFVLISSVYLMNDLMYRATPIRLYNGEGMGTGYIAGAEYLPYGADPSLFSHRDPIVKGNIEISAYDKKALTADVTCRNEGNIEGEVELPLLYYKGYTAYDQETGEKLSVYAGNNFAVSVAVPAGYQGTIHIAFQSLWYWRVGEIISVLTFILLCIRRKSK